MNKSSIEDFLSASEEAAIIDAIREAEKNTSGEIRVHIEASSTPLDAATVNVFDRATEVFNFLHMDNTKFSNGVLIYVAVEDRNLVIMGDEGINKVVANDFWESTKDLMIDHFSEGNMKQGLVDGILHAGEQLKKHFPYKRGDINELPDEISIG